MKKYIKKFLCSMISFMICMSGLNVFAQTPMQVEWYGDYSNSEKPKLVVEFTTPAMYQQRVMVTVYPDSITNPQDSDYVRVSEVAAGQRKTETVTFNITDAFSATDGAYKVELKGNGYMQDECKDSTTVYVIKPSDIPGLLNEFKNATSSTLAGVIDKVMPALQLEAETDATRRAKRIDIMFSIQANDFGGMFANLEDIRDAWNMSDVIAYITDTGSTAEGIKTRIENNSDLIGIDTENADYVAYIDTVCSDILAYSAEYNGNSGVKCIKDIKGFINQYIGIHAVNAANRDNIYNVFEQYRDSFELSADALSKYNGFARENKDKAIRTLYQKNFAKNSDLAAAFVSGVNAVVDGTESIDPPVIVIPSGGGNSGSSSISGTGVSAPTPPAQPEMTTFSDVPSSHWAYPYVTKLAKNDTIGGYDDGTFKPDKNVTREEFVKMVIGATGLLDKEAECSFSDVAVGAWYYSYIASGYANGIVSGIDDTTFGVGRNITRQDVAVIAARILQKLSAQIPETGEITLTDIDTVSDYAQDAVKLLNGMGIINGFDDNTFRPHNALTRAEAATIISKLTENL